MKIWITSAALILLGVFGFWLAQPEKPTGTPPAAVVVYGQVITQGKFAIKPGMTITDAIKEAGGFAQFAKINKMKIVNSWAPEPRYKPLLRKIAESLEPVDYALANMWSDLNLPGDAPAFDFLSPPMHQRALVNMRDSTDARTILEPGDIVMVEEIKVNF